MTQHKIDPRSIPGELPVGPKCQSSQVGEVQDMLIILKYLKGKNGDGIFGDKTFDAAKRFQEDMRLASRNGVVGNETYKALSLVSQVVLMSGPNGRDFGPPEKLEEYKQTIIDTYPGSRFAKQYLNERLPGITKSAVAAVAAVMADHPEILAQIKPASDRAVNTGTSGDLSASKEIS